MPHKATRHPRKCDIVNDVKLFLTVYLSVFCRKFLTLSNQTLCYTKASALALLIYTYVARTYPCNHMFQHYSGNL